jgi:hypothetical protein
VPSVNVSVALCSEGISAIETSFQVSESTQDAKHFELRGIG